VQDSGAVCEISGKLCCVFLPARPASICLHLLPPTHPPTPQAAHTGRSPPPLPSWHLQA
jgi:hypothetical protein